jgi:hypothetical protein
VKLDTRTRTYSVPVSNMWATGSWRSARSWDGGRRSPWQVGLFDQVVAVNSSLLNIGLPLGESRPHGSTCARQSTVSLNIPMI